MLSVNCFQLCANCSTSSGLTLPCSGLGCSSLGHFSTLVTAHWPTQSLRVPAVKSSLAVKVSLISNLGSEFQPWRLLSCGISNPEFSVVYGGFARYGRGRSSTPTSVPVIRLRGLRSAFVESISSGWQIGSNEWDEVKGMYPLVYEDSFSEARPYSIMVFDLFHVFRCIFCYWHLPFLQPGWDEQQGKLPLFYEGTRSFPSFKLLRAEMKLEASKRVFGMQDQVLGTYTLMLWFWFGMY